MKLSLEKASVIVDRALAKAREAKYRPMCVAVLDDGGCLKALKREDGARAFCARISPSAKPGARSAWASRAARWASASRSGRRSWAHCRICLAAKWCPWLAE